jgi:hypothetical protein
VRLADDARLQANVAEVIVESDFGSLLGVGIYARDRSIAKATSVFLEATRFAERLSVVHVLPRLPHAPGRLIPTLWASGSDGDLVCETICLAYRSQATDPRSATAHSNDRHVGKT